MRLDAVAEHLDVQIDPEDDGFNEAVVSTCLDKVAPIIADASSASGEEILSTLGNHFSVRFEEVRTQADIDRLEQKYLQGQRELGFAQLQAELANPSVDALLFQRQKAEEHDNDKWVAVLNLQQTESRSFFNRAHELSHRIAEPPQGLLPFKRHGMERTEPIERLMDQIAAELAFFPDVFVPLVEDRQGDQLTFALINELKNQFAASSSVLAAANSVVNAWPKPACCLTAKMAGRKQRPKQDVALRVFPQSRNTIARAADDLFVIPRMRVPKASVVYDAFVNGRMRTAVENLSTWSTSGGKTLKDANVLISAMPGFQDSVYIVMSAA
jgi:Zn-dependent peptidase ImmA (M78 family)